MLNNLANRIQNSPLLSLFVIQFILALVVTLSHGFSTLMWLGVLASAFSLLSMLKLVRDRLHFDQLDQLQSFSLILSSIFWGLYMWNDGSQSAAVYATVFVAISVSALILFNNLKLKAIICIPILLAFVGLLIFAAKTPMISTAIMSFIFISVFMVLNNEEDKVLSPIQRSKTTNTEDVTPVQPKDKFGLIDEIDALKNENTHLKEELKLKEVALSAAEMAKMEFLAMMSHEIRTPLNGIIPLLDILLDSELTDFQKDYLSTAHLSAIQMQKLIDDLLDYSKVEAGKLTVEKRGLKVARILDAVKISFKQAAQKKGIQIETNIDHSVSPFLRGDPTRLRQVLSNLLSNAIKFSSSGTVYIKAKRIKDYPTKEVIRFEVIDQGIGLDKETSDNIFKPFTQEDNSSTRKFGGTGLGLAISKKIVDLMEGNIDVNSEKGKGSTFYFDLPLLKSMGETQTGTNSNEAHQAVLINTNPALFNQIGEQLQQAEVPFQKALGLPQAYEIYDSVQSASTKGSDVIFFLDFESAGKQVRTICDDVERGKFKNNIYVCIINSYQNIAGIPSLENIKIIEKDEPIAKLITKIEVYQATANVDKDVSSSGVEQELDQPESNVDFELDPYDDEARVISTGPAHEESQLVEDITINKSQAIEDSQTPQLGEIASQQQQSTTEVETKASPATELIEEVLLVEDNEVNLKVAIRLIQYLGYSYDVANNGQEAVEKVQQNRYRMILMDCQMPVMDGYTSTSNIRDYETNNQLNRTPILAMTANAMIGDKEKCFEAGMDDYMSKPLNRFILEKTLKKWDPLSKKGFVKSKDKSKSLKDTKNSVPINPKWLSLKALADVKEYMGEETFQLLEMFENEAPIILRKIKSAITSNDFQRVKKKAHMLKSASANVGANGLSYFARKMELASMSKNKTELVALFNNIKKAYLLTMKEINKYKDSQNKD